MHKGSQIQCDKKQNGSKHSTTMSIHFPHASRIIEHYISKQMEWISYTLKLGISESRGGFARIVYKT